MTYLKEKRIAIVVDCSNAKRVISDAVAEVAVGLGASSSWTGGLSLRGSSGRVFRSGAIVPLPVLRANPPQLLELLDRSLGTPHIEAVVVIPLLRRKNGDLDDCGEMMVNRDLSSEKIAAIGLSGSAGAVGLLTCGYSLLRWQPTSTLLVAGKAVDFPHSTLSGPVGTQMQEIASSIAVTLPLCPSESLI